MSESLVFSVVVVVQLRIYTAHRCLRSVYLHSGSPRVFSTKLLSHVKQQMEYKSQARFRQMDRVSSFSMTSNLKGRRERHISSAGTSKYKCGHSLDCTSLPWNTFRKVTFVLFFFFNDSFSWWTLFGFFFTSKEKSKDQKQWMHPSTHLSMNPFNKQWKERNKKVREERVEKKGVLSCLHEIWLRQVSSLLSQMLRLSLTELSR